VLEIFFLFCAHKNQKAEISQLHPLNRMEVIRKSEITKKTSTPMNPPFIQPRKAW
jgi:hypothetical protein